MATTGPKYPGTVEDDASVGTASWTSPSNAAADDGVSAVASLFVEQSHYIVARNFDFSSIPSGATIDSVVVSVKRDGSSGNVKDVVVKLWQAGPVGDNHAVTASYWGGPAESVGYSGFGTWGLTLDWDDPQSVDFGVCISVENDSGGALPAIDVITMEILYTPAADDPPAPSSSDPTTFDMHRRRPSGRRNVHVSLGADDALIFTDQDSETPYAYPTRRKPSLARRHRDPPQIAGDITAEMDTIELPQYGGVLPPLRARLKRRRADEFPRDIVDESHPCGCVGTARVVSYGFATAKFVGASDVANVGGTYSAKLIETGYTASLVDACDCEE